MRTLTYKAEQLSSVVVPLGVQGETGATLIRIDFSEWLRDGTEGYPVITVLDPDGHPYIAATFRGDERILTEHEDGTVTFEEPEEPAEEDTSAVIHWPITDADTAHYGDGAMRLLLYSPNGAILKSAVARTNTAPSFLRFHGEPPDQYEYWLQTLEEQSAQSGANRVISQHQAEAAAKAADAAANAAANAMTYADIARLAAVAAADETTLDVVMNLTTTLAFTILTSDWEQEGLVYKTEIENEIVTGHVAGILMPDNASAPRFQDGVVIACSNGTITLTTGAVPTGTVSGTIILCGRFAPDGDDDESVMYSYWPRRASISIGTVTSVRFEDGAAASVHDENVIDLEIPAGKNLTIGTISTLDYLDGNSQPNSAAASITGDNVLNLTLVRGPKGETGDAATNLRALTAEEVEEMCDDEFEEEAEE